MAADFGTFLTLYARYMAPNFSDFGLTIMNCIQACAMARNRGFRVETVVGYAVYTDGLRSLYAWIRHGDIIYDLGRLLRLVSRRQMINRQYKLVPCLDAEVDAVHYVNEFITKNKSFIIAYYVVADRVNDAWNRLVNRLCLHKNIIY
jgi:hypothetical protein